MYLTLLKEEQKELFLGLAFHLASADGDYSDEEKAVIAGYCQEMQMTFDQDKMVKPIKEIISKINLSCNSCEKRIIVFEAIGLVMADNNYDEVERRIVKLMTDTFDLGDRFAKNCEVVLNEYISFQNRINKLVIGE